MDPQDGTLPHPFARPPTSVTPPWISPSDLAAARAAAVPLVLVDVRSTDERRFARLRDDRHVPLSELPGLSAELPRDRPIVTYDQFGPDAAKAAGLLLRTGYRDVRALDGGVDAFARLVDPSVGRYHVGPAPYVLRQLPRPDTGCLSYFLGDPVERRAVIIDPGPDPAAYLHVLSEENWRLTGIVETHTHADHLAGHAALHAATGAPILLGRRSPAQFPHRSLAEGEGFAVGTEELTVLETPGHTPDHLTVQFRDKIFTGDTLLIGGCGRTDLGEGSPEALYESLTQKILKLSDATEVFPAHYGRRHALVERFSSTIGIERTTNEALMQPDRAAFLQYMTDGWPPKPVDFDRIVAANLAPFPS
ncbi:MAG: MBL fold metallo-hydrolase [Thermoplasmata archaeon]|nr:MBL fold metallo-hydrolase [Thermoplasmata archaeon]MCI4354057.1 MBL fold metallo-hydrolase [Thermoplasmata archaeon]